MQMVLVACTLHKYKKISEDSYGLRRLTLSLYTIWFKLLLKNIEYY
jgi:hypothetical protein